MRRWIIFLSVALLVTVPDIDRCSAELGDDPGIESCLPGKDELAGWAASGKIQIAVGEDLFLLIDGAAEIFFEYGFKQAVLQSYSNAGGRSINLEIYEMDDPSSAYGVYTFRRGESGEGISFGSEGFIEDYYLNFWKGSFLVTVIGFDEEEETIEGIKTIAGAVEARIEEKGEKPRLTGLLPVDGLNPDKIKYLKGNLALFNNYEFDKVNIFGLSEGVIGIYANHKVFLFHYKDETECREWFQNGMNRLEASPDFHDLSRYGDEYTMRDRSGNHLRIEPYGGFIIIVIGSEENARSLMLKQKSMIDRSG